MKEHYLPEKVVDLFHMKHSKRREEAQSAVTRVLNVIHSEIFLTNKDVERRLATKIESVLRDYL